MINIYVVTEYDYNDAEVVGAYRHEADADAKAAEAPSRFVQAVPLWAKGEDAIGPAWVPPPRPSSYPQGAFMGSVGLLDKLTERGWEGAVDG